jgi:exodeoxyribonuclease-1
MPAPLPNSFYWHDYETWGASPRLDRPAQFAGQRTDLDFNLLGPPWSSIAGRPTTFCHTPMLA